MVIKIDEKEIMEKQEIMSEINKLREEIERLRTMINPNFIREFKKLGKETVKVDELKKPKEKSPIEELLEEGE